MRDNLIEIFLLLDLYRESDEGVPLGTQRGRGGGGRNNVKGARGRGRNGGNGKGKGKINNRAFLQEEKRERSARAAKEAKHKKRKDKKRRRKMGTVTQVPITHVVPVVKQQDFAPEITLDWRTRLTKWLQKYLRTPTGSYDLSTKNEKSGSCYMVDNHLQGDDLLVSSYYGCKTKKWAIVSDTTKMAKLNEVKLITYHDF